MLPNFLVAGVAKAGTTSLYYYLLQHPEIDIPRKETFYFAREFYKNEGGIVPPHFREPSKIIFSEEEFEKFYFQCNKKAIGEISTCYAYFYEEAIPLIQEKLGDIKIIFILRNPVERAFSAYKHFARLDAETLSFKESIEQEKIRMEKHWDFMWYYTDMGFYAKQVKAFQESFSNVKIFLTEDLSSNPQQVMKEIFQFIGVDEHFKCDTSFRYNTSDTRQDKFRFRNFVDNRFTKKLITLFLKRIISEKKRRELKHKLRTSSTITALALDAEMKTALKNLYRDDILALEKIIQRDLSKWLQ